MKKILALTLVLIMALSLATTAFAAEGDTRWRCLCGS